MLQVWWTTLVAADRGLLTMLSDAERARVSSLERAADRGRSMLGAALLRVAAGQILGVEPATVVVNRDCAECDRPHGAPRVLASGVPGVPGVPQTQASGDRGASGLPGVSVSHSGLVVAVAVSSRGPVGVDVQRTAEVADPDRVDDWVRHEAELKLRTHRPDVDSVRLIGSWAGGGGLRPPLDGYAAALAVPADVRDDLVVRHWPGGDGPEG